MKFFGLIPAGGIGSRLGNIPCSKEVYPVIRKTENGIERSVICENLIRYYRLAGITEILCILRQGKWDIPAYLRDGAELGVNIAYLVMTHPYGTPFTLDQAYPFVKGHGVALGFPDMVCTPEDHFGGLKEKLIQTDADVVLGVIKTSKYKSWDMLSFDGDVLTDIVIKEDRPDLTYGWAFAVWGPAFTEFLHSQVSQRLADNNVQGSRADGTARELYIGDIVRAAMKEGLHVDYVKFDDGTARDMGTPGELVEYLSQE
ncbi:MAG TPA: sugar phosphate nucleotidyltransferase [Cyclobacteriaceae bacterium]|nr:sugar phosphate nucleotidyltransferase [Cyclobacteriaceae bacterium]